MKVQNIQQYNTSFNAKITIKDAGKCFTPEQMGMIEQLAELIGTPKDKIFLGTKSYQTINTANYEKQRYLTRKDVLLMSLTGNRAKEFRITDKLVRRMATIKYGVEEFHEIPEEQQDNVYNKILMKNLQIDMDRLTDLKNSKPVENEDEIIKDMKQKLNDFCGVQKIQKPESFVEKIKKFITGLF